MFGIIEVVEKIDFFVSGAVYEIANPTITIFMQLVTTLGNPAFWFFVSALLLWLGKERKSFFLVVLLLIANAFVALLKEFFARPRPNVFFDVEKLGKLSFIEMPKSSYDEYSFPSGHATTATSVYAFFKESYLKKFSLFAFLIVLLVAFSRIYLLKHFLSDVLVGIAIGYIFGTLINYAEKSIKEIVVKRNVLRAGALASLAVFSAIMAIDKFTYLTAFLGYFFGYFLFKEVVGKIGKPKNGLQAATVVFLGSLWLSVMFAMFLFVGKNSVANIFLFVIGFYISFLWPYFISKVFYNKG